MLKFITYASRFVYIGLMIAFIAFGWQCYKRLPSQKKAAYYSHCQLIIIALFQILSDMLILLNTIEAGGDLKQCFLWLGAFALGMIIMGVLAETLHNGTGRLIWNAVFMMLSISVVVLWRLDSYTAIRQIRWILICFVLVNIVVLAMRGKWLYKLPTWVFVAATAGLILLPFAVPYRSGGSLNWAHIGGFVFQPSEFAKISFIFLIGYIYSRQYSFGGLLLSTGLTAFTCLVLLIQNDLGGLMIFGIVYWFMTYEYLDKKLWLILGAVLIVLAAFLAYRFVGHVRVRVDAWLNPWADINGGGYQIAHSLFAIVGGGWFGTGLFNGSPTYIPVHTTDMIFSAIAEEFGLIFSILLIVLYTFLFLTMLEYARHEGEAHKRALLLGFAVLFMTQTFVIIGGATKLIPLTGVTLPFISYGGSSLISLTIMIGIVQGIIRSSYPPVRKEARRNEYQEIQPGPQGYPEQPYGDLQPYGQSYPYAGNEPYPGPGNGPYQRPADPRSGNGDGQGTGDGSDTIHIPYQF